MERRRWPLFWHVFAVNAGLLTAIAVLLLVTPVTISFPIALVEALIVVAGLLVSLLTNAFLLRHALSPLSQLGRRMETVDLLRPRQRLEVARQDEVGRVVAAFNAMLDRLEHERQESGRRVLAAQEAERVAIARDLHDEVGQVLTGVLLQLESIAEAAPEHDVALGETREAVRRALDEVRRISSELRPEMLEHLGLASALTELSSSVGRLAGVRIERRFPASLPTLAPEVELAVYRIAQESLTNIARHAGARNVMIELEPREDTVVLRVEDDGRGLGDLPAEHGGLRGMRERALLVGGTLAIDGAAGQGVSVRLEVPVSEPARPTQALRAT